MKRKVNIKEIFLTFPQRVVIIVVGVVICTASLFFTNQMAGALREKEKNEIQLWSMAMRRIGSFHPNDPLVDHITRKSNSMPLIFTDANLNVQGTHLIPPKIEKHPDRLRREMEKLASINPPLEVMDYTGSVFYIFYGESRLLKMLVYFPLIQLIVLFIFALFAYITFRSSEQDEQNRVWIGLAKETAHQLGTPTSSLLGWIEWLRNQPIDQTAVEEMGNDLKRLMKVVDRFSKIGSETSLSPGNVNETVGDCVQYFQTRVPRNVTLYYDGFAQAPVKANINSALFEWVIENLLKNALDALQGRGKIDVKISSDNNNIYIDVSDTGKGIPKANFKRIFEPGFTTKTRGWGLGLSLSRRIIEEYHKGKIFVVDSEVDKGTTIRVVLNRIYA